MTTAVEEKRAGIVGPTVVRSKDGSSLVRARESKSQQSSQTTLFGFFGGALKGRCCLDGITR